MIITYEFTYGVCAYKCEILRDFPGSLVVKTSPSSAGDRGLIPGWGAKIACVLWAKNKTKYKTERVL